MSAGQGKLTDKKYQSAKRDIERRRKRQFSDDLVSFMGETWGRRLAYWMCFELGNIHGNSFAPSIKDGVCSALHTAHSEGRREMAGEILAYIQEVAPGAHLAMMQEQIRDRQEELAFDEEDSDHG